MSDKKRRDITLGEMQDECKQHGSTSIDACCGCPHKSWCNGNIPSDWDLSDPPRFNEQQMAFFRWWGERGAVRAIITHHFEYGAIVVFEDASRRQIGNVQETSIVAAVKDSGETLDLAELLGKDGAE